jgi:hypothetical protein
LLAAGHDSTSVTFEKLHGTLVSLSSFSAREGAQVAALSSFGILLSRVQTVLAGFQFADHASLDAAEFSAVR